LLAYTLTYSLKDYLAEIETRKRGILTV